VDEHCELYKQGSGQSPAVLKAPSWNYKVAELIAEGVRTEAPKGVECEESGEGAMPLPRKIFWEY